SGRGRTGVEARRGAPGSEPEEPQRAEQDHARGRAPGSIACRAAGAALVLSLAFALSLALALAFSLTFSLAFALSLSLALSLAFAFAFALAGWRAAADAVVVGDAREPVAADEALVVTQRAGRGDAARQA